MDHDLVPRTAARFGRYVIAWGIASLLTALLFGGGVVWRGLGTRAVALGDLWHVLFGVLLAVVSDTGLRRFGGSPRKRIAVLLVGIAIVAAAIEWGQPLWGQDRDAWDAAATVLGAIAALCWILSSQAERSRRRFLRWAMVPVLGIALTRPLVHLAAMARQCWMFPALANFESPLELVRWDARGSSVARERTAVPQGRYALRVEVTAPVSYPGVSMIGPFRSWSGYGSLEFWADVVSTAQAPRTLLVRVDDRVEPPYVDRFQTAFLLKPGWNHLAVDLHRDLRTEEGRWLNRNDIRSVTFFLHAAPSGTVFYLDDIRLAP